MDEESYSPAYVLWGEYEANEFWYTPGKFERGYPNQHEWLGALSLPGIITWEISSGLCLALAPPSDTYVLALAGCILRSTVSIHGGVESVILEDYHPLLPLHWRYHWSKA